MGTLRSWALAATVTLLAASDTRPDVGRPEAVITPETMSRVYGVEVAVLPVGRAGMRVCVPSARG